MNAWPSIAEPKFPIQEKTLLPVIKSETDSPYMQTRKKWTAAKKYWTLEWDDKVSLLETDYQTLETFFLANQGSAFTWTHPATSVTYIVFFNQDELDSTIIFPGFRSLTIELRQQ